MAPQQAQEQRRKATVLDMLVRDLETGTVEVNCYDLQDGREIELHRVDGTYRIKMRGKRRKGGGR